VIVCSLPEKEDCDDLNSNKLTSQIDEIIERFRETIDELSVNGFGGDKVLFALHYTTHVFKRIMYEAIQEMESDKRDKILAGGTMDDYLNDIEQAVVRRIIQESRNEPPSQED
jgi:hypothetical protein